MGLANNSTNTSLSNDFNHVDFQGHDDWMMQPGNDASEGITITESESSSDSEPDYDMDKVCYYINFQNGDDRCSKFQRGNGIIMLILQRMQACNVSGAPPTKKIKSL